MKARASHIPSLADKDEKGKKEHLDLLSHVPEVFASLPFQILSHHLFLKLWILIHVDLAFPAGISDLEE